MKEINELMGGSTITIHYPVEQKTMKTDIISVLNDIKNGITFKKMIEDYGKDKDGLDKVPVVNFSGVEKYESLVEFNDIIALKGNTYCSRVDNLKNRLPYMYAGYASLSSNVSSVILCKHNCKHPSEFDHLTEHIILDIINSSDDDCFWFYRLYRSPINYDPNAYINIDCEEFDYRPHININPNKAMSKSDFDAIKGSLPCITNFNDLAKEVRQHFNLQFRRTRLPGARYFAFRAKEMGWDMLDALDQFYVLCFFRGCNFMDEAKAEFKLAYGA